MALGDWTGPDRDHDPWESRAWEHRPTGDREGIRGPRTKEGAKVAAPLTYEQALARLTGQFGMPDLTARNLLFTALKGESAWFGGSRSPWRVVHESGTSREDGYRLLADGYVVRKEGESRRECRWHGTVDDDHFPCRAPGETAGEFTARCFGEIRDA
jgi:hypothetical protein